MLNKNKVKTGIGFLGAAKSFDKAPYRQVDRTPDMFLFGEKSSFITPATEQERAKCPKGIKR
ncbi:MAG: hypothetical protein UGF89_01910 [Acutalibacteraceae bacterium]|nr:hypothetical protein [Acutalibacteraceae bacterium]